MLYKEKFKSALRWNFFEASYYQFVFIIHYYFLHAICPAHTFKIMGALFALIYSLRTVIELGIEPTVAAHFSVLSQSKKQFRSFLLFSFLIPTFTIFLPAVCFTYYFFHQLLHEQSWPVLGMALTLIILECIKKTIKLCIGLRFFNKEIAAIESWSISGYLSLFWLSYLVGFPITLHSIFGLYLIIIVITTGWFLSIFTSWYRSLPENESTMPHQLKNRFFSYGYQIVNLFFSGNFLMPFFAMQCTDIDPGILYLAHTLTYSINRIIRHTFGYSSQALFANIKGKEDSYAAFSISSYYLYHGMIASLLGCALLYAYAIAHAFTSSLNLTILLLFFLIQFLENGMVTLHQFLFVFDRAHYCSIYLIITLSLMMPLWYFAPTIGSLLTLAILFILRLACVSLMNWLVIKKGKQDVWSSTPTTTSA